MTPQTLFGLTYGPAALAAVLALFAEMLKAPRAARISVSALLIAAGGTALIAGWSMKPEAVAGAFMAGGYASSVAGVVLALAGLSVLGSSVGADSSTRTALFAFAATGGALALSASDLVAMVVALEATALAGYALVASAGTRTAHEAAVKYFVQGAVATGMLVLGVAALIPLAGDLSFSGIVSGAGSGLAGPFVFGVVAVVVGLSFKAGVAPFHSWAPDAYQQAEPSAASVLSGPVKLAMVTATCVFVAAMQRAGMSSSEPFGILGGDLIVIIGVLALLSVIVGSTVALTTPSYARMLGYAGVAQVGYALIALATFGSWAAVGFTVTYAIASTGAFMAAHSLKVARPDWDGRISTLSGLGSTAPVTSAALTVILMSLAGIPPLFGFWGKYLAFFSALSLSSEFATAGMTAQSLWTGSLAGVGILASIVSLGYYGSVVRALYFGDSGAVGEDRADAAEGVPEPRQDSARVVVVAIAVVLVVLGAAPLIFGITSTLEGFLLG